GPGGVAEPHLDLAVRPGPPVPALGAQRRPDLPLLVEPPGSAGVDEERLAVVAKADLLPEPERLDGRVSADARAFPPPEQEAQRFQVRMGLEVRMRHCAYLRAGLRPRTPARPGTGTPRRLGRKRRRRSRRSACHA